MRSQKNLRAPADIIRTRSARLLPVVLCCFVHAALAPAQDVDAEPETWEPMEEIVVYGDRSLIALRKQVYRAEENFFDLFNELNDEDEFDVQCFYFAPTGTRIRRHTCRANFVVAAEAEEIINFRDGPKVAVAPAIGVIPQKRKEMAKKMLALLQERPELVEALNHVEVAKEAFYAERESRCENKVITCGQ